MCAIQSRIMENSLKWMNAVQSQFLSTQNMSFVSSNNCSDFCFAGFDGANVLGSEKRSVWWIYNGSAMFKWKLNYINNFKRDLLLTFGFIELHYKFNHEPEPIFPKNTTNKPITQNARKTNSSTTKKKPNTALTRPQLSKIIMSQMSFEFSGLRKWK